MPRRSSRSPGRSPGARGLGPCWPTARKKRRSGSGEGRSSTPCTWAGKSCPCTIRAWSPARRPTTRWTRPRTGTWILELGTGPPGLVEQPQPQHHYPGKGKAHRRINNYFHAAQSAGMCMFALLTLTPSVLTDSLTCVTGRPFTLDDVLTRGARIAALRTAFNHREGVRNLDFRLPDRAIGRPPPEVGPT